MWRLEACSAVQKAVFNFKWLVLIRQLERLQQQLLEALNHICHKIWLLEDSLRLFSVPLWLDCSAEGFANLACSLCLILKDWQALCYVF